MRFHSYVPVLSLLFSAMGCAASAAPSAEPEEDTASTKQAWSADNASDETKSTHLWIVKRAMDVLRTSSDPKAAAMVSFLEGSQCRSQWQQGLLDADYIRFYNQGGADLTPGEGDVESLVAAGAAHTTWESHFYDPDTEQNYKGNGVTARTQANRYLGFARSASFRGGTIGATEKGWDGGTYRTYAMNYSTCYALGLALHYFTDSTQPMHASNFTGVSFPLELHPHFEGYANDIKTRVESWAMAPFVPSNATSDAVLVKTAHASKERWPGIFQKIKTAAWNRLCVTYETYAISQFDDRFCWMNDPDVDQLILSALDHARYDTADYLYAAADLAMEPASTYIGDAIGVTSLAWHLNGVYVTSGNQLWHRDDFNVGSGNAWSSAGDAIGVTAMTSHDGELYVASGDHLWKRGRLGPGTGNDWSEAGVAYSVSSMASLDGALYAVSNGHLWKRGALGPNTGNDWSEAGIALDVTGLTSYGGHLYVVSNGWLWKRGQLGPDTGNDWTRVGSTPGVTGLTYPDAGIWLFATTSDDQLRRIDITKYPSP